MTDLRVDEVGPEAARDLVEVVQAAFGARPPLDPPAPALHETVDSARAALREHGGLLARVDGRPAGALLFEPDGSSLWLRRVSVDPRWQHRGVASALVGCAEEVAEDRRFATVCLIARLELPATQRFWMHRGYVETARDGVMLTYSKAVPLDADVPTPDATRELGRRLADVVRAGDLVLLAGDLGSGKTTFTQGIGAGLRVRGPVTSPTFVIARVHPPLVDGVPLVHVDAYRLGGLDELDDLDLDTSLDDAVTVVEWGEGLAEPLSSQRLDVTIRRPRGGTPGGAADEDEESRHIQITPVGRRWVDADLGPLRDAVRSGGGSVPC
ncbi:MAG: tRNA (adenosine(37)-N6)-threonylcarbamoyltransferase complex ATPase subunit type 1 TsaE [Propionibacteriales bacterium]|nr:tRNA (adenosine(37)-N6)-threonylcarbamoyltransferase complex ATPase subunit type 1 TsaE [Propionibacteriales bacterium]